MFSSQIDIIYVRVLWENFANKRETDVSGYNDFEYTLSVEPTHEYKVFYAWMFEGLDSFISNFQYTSILITSSSILLCALFPINMPNEWQLKMYWDRRSKETNTKHGTKILQHREQHCFCCNFVSFVQFEIRIERERRVKSSMFT